MPEHARFRSAAKARTRAEAVLAQLPRLRAPTVWTYTTQVEDRGWTYKVACGPLTLVELEVPRELVPPTWFRANAYFEDAAGRVAFARSFERATPQAAVLVAVDWIACEVGQARRVLAGGVGLLAALGLAPDGNDPPTDPLAPDPGRRLTY